MEFRMVYGLTIILMICHPGCYKIIAERVAVLDSEQVEGLLTEKAEWRVGQQTKSIYGHSALHAAACNTRNVFNFYLQQSTQANGSSLIFLLDLFIYIFQI